MSLRHWLNSDVNITPSYRILVKTPTGMLALRKPFLGKLLCELHKYIKRRRWKGCCRYLGIPPQTLDPTRCALANMGPRKGPTWTAALQNGIFVGLLLEFCLRALGSLP